MLVPEELQGTAEEGEEGCHGPGRHFLILKEGKYLRLVSESNKSISARATVKG